jgi:hypothetical protein
MNLGPQTEDYLKTAHQFAAANEDQLKKSKLAGCFHCLQIFKADEIDWGNSLIDRGGRTAQCPYCGIDSIIGDASGFPLQAATLQQMRVRWFENADS